MKIYQKKTELSNAEYREVLDEIYGDVEICGMMFSSGSALQELDETAFESGKSEHESALDSESLIWVCGACGEEHEGKRGEESAEECCKADAEAASDEEELKK